MGGGRQSPKGDRSELGEQAGGEVPWEGLDVGECGELKYDPHIPSDQGY